MTHGVSSAETIGRADTRGTAITRGTSEAFEPLYALLPTSFHSKDNALYMAAQLLRCLKTGSAYVRYFDRSSARETFLAVPRVVEYSISDEVFEALRERVLSASPAAVATESAREHVDERERELIGEAIAANTPGEPITPAGYRIKKKRPLKEMA